MKDKEENLEPDLIAYTFFARSSIFIFSLAFFLRVRMSQTRKENASRVGIETVVNVQILFCFYNDNHYPDQSLFVII